MKSAKLLVLMVASALIPLLAGCAGSLRPVADGKDLVFDPRLVGTWKQAAPEKSEDVWTVKKSGEIAYELSLQEPDRDYFTVYALELFRLGQGLFVDAHFSRLDQKGHSIQEDDLGVLPVHIFGRIWFQADKVRLGLLNEDWLKNTLKESRVRLDYEEEGDDVLLTGSSAEVRKFALTYADDKEAFPPEIVFERQK